MKTRGRWPGGSESHETGVLCMVIVAALATAGCLAIDETPSEVVHAVHVAGAATEDPAYLDARTLFTAPAGTYIEGLALHGERVYTGTAFGATGNFAPITNLGEPSRIFVLERATGDLLDTIVVQGEDTTTTHGVTGIETDTAGRVYVGSDQLGVLRFTETASGWSQEALPLPDLPPCLAGASPCSPTPDDRPGLANDLTWDAEGNLYVSDSFQATIWRIAPDGTLTIWAQHEDLHRIYGPNGLRVRPDGQAMTVAITGPDSVRAGPVDRASKVFDIPFPDPAAGPMVEVLSLGNEDLADGLAYAATGDLYVLSNAGNKVIIVKAATGEVRTITTADLNGDAVLDFPASLVFDGTGSLIIANYAWADGQANPAGRTLVDIFVGDPGWPEPKGAGPTAFAG